MTVDRTLLPVHFAVDPGADFTWWRDEEDEKIAQKLELSDADKLTLISQVKLKEYIEPYAPATLPPPG